MNYQRIRNKLKEKQKELRSLHGSERQRAEQLIIDQVNNEKEEVVTDLDKVAEEPVEKVKNKGKKRGPKPRR